LLNSLHAFTAHRFSESQRTNLQDRSKYFVPSSISEDTFSRHCNYTKYLLLKRYTAVFHNLLHILCRALCTLPTQSYESFLMLHKNATNFSRKNDSSRTSLYLSVPVSLLQHKWIRDFERLRIVKPSVCPVIER